jgi:superfamily II DNA or RNA helicase
MVFCANIENAELVAQQISNAGYLVTIGHSKRKDEAYQVNLFKDPTSGYNIFVSVAAYTVGFDHPPVDRLMLYRAFGSCSLYMQTLFRADRICEGKKEFDVYDYGGNKRHGFYYFDRPNDKLWQSTALRLSPKEQGVEPIKECPVCHALIGLMARTCPVCNAEQPVNEAENKQGELINITATYQAMMGRNIGTLSARELSIYAKLKNKAQFAIRIARSKRQTEISVYANAVKPPSYIPDPLRDANFLRDFAHYMDYKSSWCYQQYKIIEASKEAIEFTNFRLK